VILMGLAFLLFAFFGITGAVAVAAGVVVFAVAPWISRQMEGVD
jgi:POT family proton-dependent oligopeptide transporter